MCLIAFALNTSPALPFVLLANRDEYHHRATAPLGHWDDQPQILAGRDLIAGGTWLGLNRNGRFAALTNVREPTAPGTSLPSRGELPTDFLASDLPAQQWMQTFDAQRYAGFNLILGDLRAHGRGSIDCHYASNRGTRTDHLPAGIYGLSNSVLNGNWPKVSGLRDELESALAHINTRPSSALSLKSQIETVLLPLLHCEQTPPDHLLPETGVSIDQERLLSRRFIISPTYGTRSSTIVLMTKAGQIVMSEWRYNTEGTITGHTCITFTLRH
jgi:uncharacterized protein with NRDE domain